MRSAKYNVRNPESRCPSVPVDSDLRVIQPIESTLDRFPCPSAGPLPQLGRDRAPGARPAGRSLHSLRLPHPGTPLRSAEAPSRQTRTLDNLGYCTCAVPNLNAMCTTQSVRASLSVDSDLIQPIESTLDRLPCPSAGPSPQLGRDRALGAGRSPHSLRLPHRQARRCEALKLQRYLLPPRQLAPAPRADAVAVQLASPLSAAARVPTAAAHGRACE